MKTRIIIPLLIALMGSAAYSHAQGRGTSPSSNATTAGTGSGTRSSQSDGGAYRSAPAPSNTRSNVGTQSRSTAGAPERHNARAAQPQHTVPMSTKPQPAQPAPRYKDRHIKVYPRQESHVVARHYDRHINDISHHVRIHHSNVDYYYRDGIYYTLRDNRYVVVTPPRHIRVTAIPSSFFAFRIGNLDFFYSDGAYYNYINGYYEVVDPPMGAIVPALPIYDVNTLIINGRTYLEYDGILYKPTVSSYGTRYKVMGRLSDVLY